MTNFTNRVMLLFFCLLLGLALSACGKRGTYLYPPSEDIEDKFPASYPDPATDPAPVSKK
jgi:predicted small lipoprotein YifL